MPEAFPILRKGVHIIFLFFYIINETKNRADFFCATLASSNEELHQLGLYARNSCYQSTCHLITPIHIGLQLVSRPSHMP